MPQISFWLLFSFDKWAHAIVFAIFTYLLSLGLKKQFHIRFLRNNGVKLAVTVGILYGSILELFQGLLFEGRNAEWADMAANATGSFIGIFLFWIIFGKVISSLG